MFYKIVNILFRVVFMILYRPKIIGRNNIPKSGRVVIAGNHTNNLDSVMMGSFSNRKYHFLAKKELFVGIMKPILKWLGSISVDRSIKDKNALKEAIDVLNHDEVVALFPEGTINRTDDTIMKFKIGAVKMAHDTNSLIVPFIITGKYKLFGIGDRVKLEYLEPIKVGDDLDFENNRLMDIIKNKLEEENEKSK